MQNYAVETTRGSVVFSSETREPNVLLIHGFKRAADQLAPWHTRIPNLAFVHLPDHSGSPKLDEVSIAAWTDALDQMMKVFKRPPLILAESLGSILALSVRSRAVIAVEPLMSTDQLWPLHRTLRSAPAKGVEIDDDLMSLFDKPFDWVLDRIRSPTLVIAGLTPLLPERDVRPEPSLLTDEDFARYAAHPMVEARRIPGGHNLLDHNPEGVMAAAADFMARHGYLNASDPPKPDIAG